MSETNQTDLFGAGAQADLFGASVSQAYVPDPQHVRNRLDALLTEMRGSARWPWPEAMVDLHRTRTFAYLCGLLPAEEAAQWQRAIAAEVERLDAPAQAAE